MLDPYIEAWQLRKLAVKKEIRPREVAEFFLARIEKLNPRLNAYVTVAAERAMADARRLERAGAKAKDMPLYGVAYSLKDLTPTRDIVTTFGSKNYERYMPPADAELAVRLRNAGGILLGKTATPEFGGRPTTEGGLCPPARNPWNPNHTTGGSSGGAAAAVASGLGPIAEGSDGGGSIRIPAACCGIVGLKPSRGRVTLAPFFGEAWGGLFVNGPIARSVRDAALMLDAMMGPVAGDPYWAAPPAKSFSAALNARPRKLRLAALAHSTIGTVEPETMAAFESACRLFKQMGHRVERAKLDPAARLVEPTGIVIGANIAAVQFPDPDLIDPVVRVFYEAGLKTSAAQYLNAMTQMHNAAREVVQQLIPYDALLTPTLTRPAVPIGSLPSSIDAYTQEAFGWLPFTFPFNATGQPAISLPNGFSKAGLPIGLQIVGRPNDEAGIIALAAAFEEARPWGDRKPPVE